MDACVHARVLGPNGLVRRMVRAAATTATARPLTAADAAPAIPTHPGALHCTRAPWPPLNHLTRTPEPPNPAPRAWPPACLQGVFVVERPGLREFLEELAAFAEVIIYTAGARLRVSDHDRVRARASAPAPSARASAAAAACSSSSSTHSERRVRRCACTPPPPPPFVCFVRAGLEDYARPIIDAIDPSGKLLAGRIYREGTLRTDYYQCVKVRVGGELGVGKGFATPHTAIHTSTAS